MRNGPPPFAVAFATAALAAGPADAVTVFLDHNADGDLTTFENLVVGPVSVPVDIVVWFAPADLNTSFLSVMIQWGYGGGGLGCYDVYGSTDVEYYIPLPDSPPFVNILPYTCVCFGRCSCDAMVVIDADVSGLTSPGPYLLARVEFSRRGFAVDCSHPIYPVAEFQAFCVAGNCENPIGDPRTTMTLRETAVTAGSGVEERTWGRMKALYR